MIKLGVDKCHRVNPVFAFFNGFNYAFVFNVFELKIEDSTKLSGLWRNLYKSEDYTIPVEANFGNAFRFTAAKEDLMKATDEKIADAIIGVREGKVKIKPGYDGVYGQPVFDAIIVVGRFKASIFDTFKIISNGATSFDVVFVSSKTLALTP